jgi:Fur family ferric uptake transcriptional regulator
MESVKDVLKDNKFKLTPAREKILGLFYENDKPIDVDFIFKNIDDNKINQVTVYRTVESFLKKGLIHKVDLRKNSVFYELKERHHHHIVCTSCGDVEEFDICMISKNSSLILSKSKKFKNIIDHSFEFFGVCKKCLK